MSLFTQPSNRNGGGAEQILQRPTAAFDSAERRQRYGGETNTAEMFPHPPNLITHIDWQVRPLSLRASAFPSSRARAKACTLPYHSNQSISTEKPMLLQSALKRSQLRIFRRAPGVFSWEKKTL